MNRGLKHIPGIDFDKSENGNYLAQVLSLVNFRFVDSSNGGLIPQNRSKRSFSANTNRN